VSDDDFDLVGRVRIDTSDLGNVSSSITGSFGKMAGIASAALAGIGLEQWVKGGIDSLTNMDRIQQQTAAVIKSTGGAAGVSADQIGSFADQIEKATGIESESVREGENMLLTFTNIKNGVGAGNDVFNQATSILTDMSTAMGTDAKSSAIQLGKALNDPVKGVTALTKVGVTFSDEQKKVIEQMVQTGNVAGAQKVILAELNKEFGGSAEAFGKSGAGAVAKFNNSMGDLQETVAAGVLPVVMKLTDFVTQNMPKVIDGIATVFDDLAGGFENPDAGIAFGGLEAVLLRIGQTARNVVDTVKSVASIVGSLISGDTVGAGVDIGKLFGAEEGSTATDTIIKALQTVRDVVGQVVAFVEDNLPKVIAAFQSVGDFLSSNIMPVLGAVAGLIAGAGVASLVGSVLTAVGAIGTFIATAGGPLAAVIAALGGPVTLAIAGIAALVAGVIYAYQHFQAFHDVVDKVISFVQEQFTHLIAFAQEILPQLEEAVGHVFHAIQDVIEVVLGVILGAWHIFGDDLLEIVGGVFDVIKAIVETAVNTVAGIIRLVLAVINGDWGKAWQALKDIVAGIFDGIKGVISGALQAVVGIIGAVYDGLKHAAAGAFKAITDSIMDVVGGMYDIGKNIIGGIIDGIRSMAGKLIDAIKHTVTDALPSFAKDALGIHSPSTVFRDIFRYVPAGAALGIADGAGAVQRALNDMLDIGTLRFGTDSALAGRMSGGGLTIGEININGVANADDLRGAIPELTDALRAAVGGR
jgi:hypothetical protein